MLQMVHQLGAAPENVDRAKGLFRWSIFYMFGICLLLVVSRLPMAANFDLQAWSLLQQMASSGQFI